MFKYDLTITGLASSELSEVLKLTSKMEMDKANSVPQGGGTAEAAPEVKEEKRRGRKPKEEAPVEVAEPTEPQETTETEEVDSAFDEFAEEAPAQKHTRLQALQVCKDLISKDKDAAKKKIAKVLKKFNATQVTAGLETSLKEENIDAFIAELKK